MTKLNNCPFCGKTPEFKVSKVQYGHGSNGYEYRVECQCGIMTKSIDDYSKSAEECMSIAATIWNNRI